MFDFGGRSHTLKSTGVGLVEFFIKPIGFEYFIEISEKDVSVDMGIETRGIDN